MRGVTYKVDLCPGDDDPGKAEILRTVLLGAGVPPERTAELYRDGRVHLSFYTKKRTRARSLASKLRRSGLKGITVKGASLKDSDWKTKWKKTYKPFMLTRNILVIPARFKDTCKKKAKKCVSIDTALAFGTGLHFTTRSMAEFIEMEEGRFDDFFDAGTGSGILSIIARKSGARRVWGIDIDKEAVKAARKNLKENSCGEGSVKQMDLRSFPEGDAFDFVAANINTRTLLANRGKLIALTRPGKYLAVSGVAVENYGEFRRKFDTKRLRCLRVKKDREWTAVLYKRTWRG